MSCTFFGHRDVAPQQIKEPLKQAILDLITVENIKSFYVGNSGRFDALVQCVLKEIHQIRKDIEYTIVLSYIGEKALSGEQQMTLLPEGLETAPRRFALVKRNEWMLAHSAWAVVYVRYSFSNCAKWAQRAIKKGIRVKFI